MWLVLNDAFLSIVDHRDKKDMLRVRARVEGDIERVFPEIKAEFLRKSDYAYHADVPRSLVAERVARIVSEVDYTNFKNSVKESDRHSAYLSIWSAMHKLQSDREWGTRKADPFLDMPPLFPSSWSPPSGGSGVGWRTSRFADEPTAAELGAMEDASEEPITDLPQVHNPKRLRRHLTRTHQAMAEELEACLDRADMELLHDEKHFEEEAIAEAKAEAKQAIPTEDEVEILGSGIPETPGEAAEPAADLPRTDWTEVVE